MATETSAERKARLQKEADDKAAKEEREAAEREVYEQHGLDYDDEETRRAVQVRRASRALDKAEEEREKTKNPKKRSLL